MDVGTYQATKVTNVLLTYIMLILKLLAFLEVVLYDHNLFILVLLHYDLDPILEHNATTHNINITLFTITITITVITIVIGIGIVSVVVCVSCAGVTVVDDSTLIAGYGELAVYFELVVLHHGDHEGGLMMWYLGCILRHLIVFHLLRNILRHLMHFYPLFASINECYRRVLALLNQYLIPILVLGHHNTKEQFGHFLQSLLPYLILPGLVPTEPSHLLRIVYSSQFLQRYPHPFIKCNLLQLLACLYGDGVVY